MNTEDVIQIVLTKDELLIVLHALLSSQFPLDMQEHAYNLYSKLKIVIIS